MQHETIFNHTAHKALWNWLSKNPDKCKSDWKGWVRNGGTLAKATSDCFACETRHSIIQNIHVRDISCSTHCPFSVKNSDIVGCLDGKYFKWELSKRKDYKKLWAERIRDLPIRPDFTGKVI